METRDLNTWAEFVSEVNALRAPVDMTQDLATALLRSTALFRGQSDATWKLATTLERAWGDHPDYSLPRYFGAVCRAYPALVAHTGRQWDLPKFSEYAAWASDYDSLGPVPEWKAYELMAYLRHHGFPSPLLDWSRSPYVAAFFAFRATTGTSDRVAIFAYRENEGEGKVTSSGSPQIVQLDQYVSTHARHFRQQCQYTVCVQYGISSFYFGEQDGNGLIYADHESVFENPITKKQDRLWRFTLPRSLRPTVLAELNEFNLNAYSLFGSEDALVETLAATELH